MRSIAVLTMIFLPATLVAVSLRAIICAIFMGNEAANLRRSRCSPWAFSTGMQPMGKWCFHYTYGFTQLPQYP